MRRLSLPELRRLGGERWTAGGSPLLAQLPMIPTFQELRPALDGELRRSRRYERPLAVLVVVPDVEPLPTVNGNGSSSGNGSSIGHSVPNGNGARAHGVHDAHGASNGGPGGHEINSAIVPVYWAQLRFLMLGSLLCGTLRESDVVSYAAELHEFVALLPECTGAAARQAVDRLHQVYSNRMAIGVRAGIAVYPADGLTLDDLLDHARRALALAPIGQATMNRTGNGGAHA